MRRWEMIAMGLHGAALLAAPAAQAWDPNAGAGWAAPASAPRANVAYYPPSRTYRAAAPTPTPARSYAPPAARPSLAPSFAAAPMPAAPARQMPSEQIMPASSPAPMTVAPATHTAMRQVPAEQLAPMPAAPPVALAQTIPAAAPMPAMGMPAYALQPVPAPTPMPLAADPAPMPMVVASGQPPADYSHWTSEPPLSRIAFGIEGFYDNYQEDSVGLDNEATNGSITLDYDHFFDDHLFVGIDGRVSYGEDDYRSDTGSTDGIPVWEYELRGKLGARRTTQSGAHVDFYSGLGLRYYDYQFKGHDTVVGSTTYVSYDRRITQLYLPIGMTHTSDLGGWAFRKNIEADALLWGNVSSRIGTLSGYGNVENRQTPFSGVGVRGELTFGYLNARGSGVEFGPFVRYWWVGDSDPETDSVSTQNFIEPENSRLQLGAALRYLF